jgi:serine phosphatase RsbU (regulator of sigma subunit)
VQLNPGDVVVLYTDGIPEAFDIIPIIQSYATVAKADKM